MRAWGFRQGIGRLLGPILLGLAFAGCTGTTPSPEFDFASQRTTFVTHDDFDNLNPAWSPDGRTVAYVSNRSGAWNLWSIDIDGGDPRPLTTGTDEDRFPAFSPDGQRIAFASRRSGNWDVWVINRDGTGLSQLTTHRMDDLAPAWNRDGTRIAFDSYRDFEYSIYVMDADGGRQAPERLRVIRTCPLPSGFITQMSRPPSRSATNAIFDPSALKAGIISRSPSVWVRRRYGPFPDASTA